mgnify:CR=1 FL=1
MEAVLAPFFKGIEYNFSIRIRAELMTFLKQFIPDFDVIEYLAVKYYNLTVFSIIKRHIGNFANTIAGKSCHYRRHLKDFEVGVLKRPGQLFIGDVLTEIKT